MMVHFEDTFITLRAVMGPIRLGSKASCTHSDSSELFTLEGHDHWRRLIWLFNKLISFNEMYWSSLALNKPIIEVTRLSRVLLVLNNLLVIKVFLWLSF